MSDTPDSTLPAEVEIMKELLRLENSGQGAEIVMGPFTMYMIIGLCQLGVKTLKPGDERAQLFRKIAGELEPYFESTSAGDFINDGWIELENRKKNA